MTLSEQKKVYRATWTEHIVDSCGCCSYPEDQEGEFDSLQDAYDWVEDRHNWKIYLNDEEVLHE